MSIGSSRPMEDAAPIAYADLVQWLVDNSTLLRTPVQEKRPLGQVGVSATGGCYWSVFDLAEELQTLRAILALDQRAMIPHEIANAPQLRNRVDAGLLVSEILV